MLTDKMPLKSWETVKPRRARIPLERPVVSVFAARFGLRHPSTQTPHRAVEMFLVRELACFRQRVRCSRSNSLKFAIIGGSHKQAEELCEKKKTPFLYHKVRINELILYFVEILQNIFEIQMSFLS